MLQKKYHIDREFKIILLLSGEMDEQMTVIDHLLCDNKLLELMEADFSKRYPLTSKTGRKSTKRIQKWEIFLPRIEQAFDYFNSTYVT